MQAQTPVHGSVTVEISPSYAPQVHEDAPPLSVRVLEFADRIIRHRSFPIQQARVWKDTFSPAFNSLTTDAERINAARMFCLFYTTVIKPALLSPNGSQSVPFEENFRDLLRELLPANIVPETFISTFEQYYYEMDELKKALAKIENTFQDLLKKLYAKGNTTQQQILADFNLVKTSLQKIMNNRTVHSKDIETKVEKVMQQVNAVQDEFLKNQVEAQAIGESLKKVAQESQNIAREIRIIVTRK